jgi:E3 ubiquitin-protein ligase MARCH6
LGKILNQINFKLSFKHLHPFLSFQDGLRGLNLGFLIPGLVIPTVTALGLALSLPYMFAHSLMPLLFTDPVFLTMIQRRIYPCLLLLIVAVGLVVMQLKQFRKLYEHIKNDRQEIFYCRCKEGERPQVT